jgi:signal transduction histidine kinase
MSEPHKAKPEPDPKGPDYRLPRDERPSVALMGKSVLNLLPVGIVLFDSDLMIRHCNARAAALIPTDTDLDKALAKVIDTNPSQIDWTALLKSCLGTPGPRVFEDIPFEADNEPRLLRISCAGLYEAERTADCAGAVLIEDLTENRNMQARLFEAEKFANIGRLASKVAHELNNPLDGILRYVNLALRAVEHENLEKPKQYLTRSRQAIMRMVHIVADLLEFTRSGPSPLEEVRIEQVIEDAITTVQSAAEAAPVRIIRDYASDLPEMKTGNLFQVFVNIIKNAIDAMPNGGRLYISTRIGPDNSIAVEFRDTGRGFDPANAEAIFQPFFTTKQPGCGTGLGLAISRDIVERYQGRITAENVPTGGSVFTVLLPLKEPTEKT